jgi:hypothetical protein
MKQWNSMAQTGNMEIPRSEGKSRRGDTFYAGRKKTKHTEMYKNMQAKI